MRQNYLYIMKKKIKGFMLVELVFSIALISFILISLTYVVHTSTIVSNKMEKEYENSLNLEFTIDYILSEIDSSDKIIIGYINGISRKNQLGLVLLNYDSYSKYSYTTYILKDKQIIRLNYKSNVLPNYFTFGSFNGRNPIIDNVNEFDCSYNSNNKMLNVNISSDNYSIKESHNIRGVIFDE